MAELAAGEGFLAAEGEVGPSMKDGEDCREVFLLARLVRATTGAGLGGAGSGGADELGGARRRWRRLDAREFQRGGERFDKRAEQVCARDGIGIWLRGMWRVVLRRRGALSLGGAGR